ncbi:hypothetical protein BAZSYMB_SCAFFOLD00015_0 [Bathymodiolus azoricus thioautotrophic gill symbiont]|uniref:Uncharacterized protein n=1 Tax=Bathymodiolus azoricus thioautotrophic gill symbiont TaxID=235205 RepID=A0A1H6KM06_9GAMM|nr:hypothetical protein BAZSYMB_SCAFFOLD00015_0 [Bathymodiolus azoricus thioautotrophic gill symbiont]
MVFLFRSFAALLFLDNVLLIHSLALSLLHFDASFSMLYFASELVSSDNKPILIAIPRKDASPADSAPNGITIRVNTVDTNTPNNSEIAMPWKIGSDKITLEPPTSAKAVIIIGRVLDAQEFTTASKNGTPLAYSCTVKSTNKIELRTIMPAKAIQPIIEVAVNSAPSNQCPGTMPNSVSGIGAIITAGTMKLPNCQTTNI